MWRVIFLLFLCLVIFGVVAWSTGFLNPEPTAAGQSSQTGEESDAQPDEQLGNPLYQGKAISAARPKALETGADPTVIPSCQLVVIDKVDVPCRADGKLLFIGTQVTEPKDFRDTDKFIQIGKRKIRYRPLQEGSRVQPSAIIVEKNGSKKEQEKVVFGQMVALLDPTLAENQLEGKQAKLSAARADFKSAIGLAKVYQGEVDRLNAALRISKDAVSASEYAIMVANKEKYKFEAESKKEAIQVAENDVKEAQILLDFHTLRVPFQLPRGARPEDQKILIKTVYKLPGEAVKNQEPVVHLHNITRLRAEGLVNVQYRQGLRQGMKVEVEATTRRKPFRAFLGHRGEVTAVAVSGDDQDPFIISGSEDGSARVWKQSRRGELQIWRHPAAVRSIACTPKGAKDAHGKLVNWCLTGCADGSVRLWDLDKIPKDSTDPIEPLWVRKEQHGDAVNCLAFSPPAGDEDPQQKGVVKWYVSGGEDNLIKLWKTEAKEDEKELVYKFNPDKGHQGAVTSLHFTPDLKVVSAGRDNTILVWTLCQKGARLNAKQTLTGRSGNVTSLGVSRDGKYALFDQGKRLQVMARGQTVGVIQDPAESAAFETLALFSPDASLILTTNSSEGRLQLWRSPTDYPRSYEVRQFITRENIPVTCAAFGGDTRLKSTAIPDANREFVAVGTKDGQVLLWAVPGKELVNKEKQLSGKITLMEQTVDPVSKQARIWVEVDNRSGNLTPGEIVTIVVPPQK
jgi:WD40 repeat protein